VPVLPSGRDDAVAASQPAGSSWAKLGAPAGLCAGCVHGRLNETRRGTAYLRCLKAQTDARFAQYPRLPVLACPGFEDAPR
jgi:hypothetical protein